ncbi:hypothetical protein DFJ73DRAFT_849683 [Zopfochytrium polystomum]|nr:hypothetical protein DFJ73DRAFT_849683 [Zopfochytrium polystomum]
MGGGGVGGGAGAVGGSYVNGGRLVVAIIGAGISGLSAASRIAEIATRRSLPISTIVLDKGRSVGGRCATRRTTTYPLAFWDTGAQFFTASDPRMRPLLTSLESSDLIGVWSYSGAGLSPPEHAGPARPHYAFRRSGMNQLPIFMAERLLAATAAHREHAHGNGASSCSLHVNAEVLSIAANPRSHDAKKPWRVQWKNALEPAGLAAATEAAPSLPSADFVDADVVVLTSPVPQSLALLKRGSVRLSEVWHHLACLAKVVISLALTALPFCSNYVACATGEQRCALQHLL